MKYPAIAALAACAWAVTAVRAAEVDVTQPVKAVEQRTPLHADGNAAQKSFKFALWRSLVMPTDQVGGLSQGMFCGSARPVYYNKEFGNFVEATVLRAFRDESTKAGYTQADRGESRERLRAAFRATAATLRLTDRHRELRRAARHDADVRDVLRDHGRELDLAARRERELRRRRGDLLVRRFERSAPHTALRLLAGHGVRPRVQDDVTTLKVVRALLVDRL